MKYISGELSGNKDIDAVHNGSNVYEAYGTAEAVFRLVIPFLNDDIKIAVVGCNGFVGKHVCKLLKKVESNYIGLDFGDDLLKVSSVDIVISATGHPGLLDHRHLQKHHLLVIDVGFSPFFTTEINIVYKEMLKKNFKKNLKE